jgi:hypothetical protein
MAQHEPCGDHPQQRRDDQLRHGGLRRGSGSAFARATAWNNIHVTTTTQVVTV